MSYVWVFFFLRFGVSNSYVYLLVFLRLGVSNSYVWGLVNLTFEVLVFLPLRVSNFLGLEVSFFTFRC